MECKEDFSLPCVFRQFRINGTKVECKAISSGNGASVTMVLMEPKWNVKVRHIRTACNVICINGTKVECKALQYMPTLYPAFCINGTKVECKAGEHVHDCSVYIVLMEPKWNVKEEEELTDSLEILY